MAKEVNPSHARIGVKLEESCKVAAYFRAQRS